MRPLFILLLTFQALIGAAQQWQGFFSVVAKSSYYTVPETGPFNARFENNTGYAIGASVDSLKFGPLKKLKIAARIESYKTSFSVGDRSGLDHIGEIHKTLLSIAAFPVRIQVANLQFNLGPEYSRVIYQSAAGIYSSSSPGEERIDYEFRNNQTYSYKSIFGARAELGYRIKLGTRFLTPRYGYYLGFTPEFRKFNFSPMSMRHEFGISVTI